MSLISLSLPSEHQTFTCVVLMLAQRRIDHGDPSINFMKIGFILPVATENSGNYQNFVVGLN